MYLDCQHLRPKPWLALGLALWVLVFATSEPAHAVTLSQPTPPCAPQQLSATGPMSSVVLAFSWRSWIRGHLNRTRVIQGCMVCMALALFIMMRKFSSGRE